MYNLFQTQSSENLENWDDLDEMLGGDGEGGGKPQDKWTDDDEALLAPCLGLIKVHTLICAIIVKTYFPFN